MTNEWEVFDWEEEQSEMAGPAPPTTEIMFGSFEEAQNYYQDYTKFHGFSIRIDHRQKLKSGEYSRGELVCYKAGKHKTDTEKTQNGQSVVPERKLEHYRENRMPR